MVSAVVSFMLAIILALGAGYFFASFQGCSWSVPGVMASGGFAVEAACLACFFAAGKRVLGRCALALRGGTGGSVAPQHHLDCGAGTLPGTRRTQRRGAHPARGAGRCTAHRLAGRQQRRRLGRAGPGDWLPRRGGSLLLRAGEKHREPGETHAGDAAGTTGEACGAAVRADCRAGAAHRESMPLRRLSRWRSSLQHPWRCRRCRRRGRRVKPPKLPHRSGLCPGDHRGVSAARCEHIARKRGCHSWQRETPLSSALLKTAEEPRSRRLEGIKSREPSPFSSASWEMDHSSQRSSSKRRQGEASQKARQTRLAGDQSPPKLSWPVDLGFAPCTASQANGFPAKA